jgi:hypothetical protein
MKSFLLISVALVLSACASTDRSLRTLSTQPINGTAVGSQERVSGLSCRRDILFFIALEKGGELESAIDDALSKAPGANLLTEVKVTKKRLMTGAYNYRCLEVEGKALSIR